MQTGLSDRTFSYNPQALALLGIRTSVVVATVLSIPDAVALIPGSTTVTAWLIGLVGCWVTALVLWFVFFVGMLHVIRFIMGGITVGDSGIRLWRFGKLIDWKDVRAVGVEDEGAFTRLFSYDKSVKRLTLFVSMKNAKGFLKSVVVPNYIASFFFSAKDFAAMCDSIARHKYGLENGSTPALLLFAEELPPLKKTHDFIRWQRVVISLLITCGITLFLARRATVLYSYNEGLKAYRQGDFVTAGDRFQTATEIEPTFAPAWHGLAGSEFNRGDFEKASKHWGEALKWKPDYVEAKVSLAYMSLQRRDFARAEKLISSALSLAPSNPTALLNRADLNMRTGHIREAVQDARLVLTIVPHRNGRESFMATCLLAEAKLLQGHPRAALGLLAPLPVAQSNLQNGENLTYRLLVGSKTFLSMGQTSKAEKLAQLALERAQNVDALLVMAQVRTASKEYDVARTILERCQTMMPENPWVYVYAAELNIKQKRFDQASENLKSAEQCRPLDPLSLSRIARIYSDIGEPEQAVEAARMSLKMEPVNPAALQVIEQHAASQSL